MEKDKRDTLYNVTTDRISVCGRGARQTGGGLLPHLTSLPPQPAGSDGRIAYFIQGLARSMKSQMRQTTPSSCNSTGISFRMIGDSNRVHSIKCIEYSKIIFHVSVLDCGPQKTKLSRVAANTLLCCAAGRDVWERPLHECSIAPVGTGNRLSGRRQHRDREIY